MSPGFVHSPSGSPESRLFCSALKGPVHTSPWRPQFPCLQNGFIEVSVSEEVLLLLLCGLWREGRH